MHTLACISTAACLREAVASLQSQLKEGGDLYPPWIPCSIIPASPEGPCSPLQKV